MRSFEIFVAPEPPKALALSESTDVPAISTRRMRRRPAREVLDIFIEGANVTARVADAQASCVLRDLGHGLVDLATRVRGKAIVRFYDDPWELAVERLGGVALLSVYRAGSDPFVAVYDRSVPFSEIVDSTRDAIRSVIQRGSAPRPVELELEGLERALGLALAPSGDLVPDGEGTASALVTVEADRDAPVAFCAEFSMRSTVSGGRESASSVERTDLHALLFRGRLRAEVRGRSFDLGEGHPLLLAERLVELSRRAFEAWERGLSYNVRSDVAGTVVGIRLSADGRFALSLGTTRPGVAAERSLYTFPGLGLSDVVQASVSFGRALVRAVLRRDRSQCSNLRLTAFRRSTRELADEVREASRTDCCTNPAPEAYRAFAESARTRSDGGESTISGTRLRYSARWRAIVPGIDLRSTFLCGDRLVVGSTTETFCLERGTGDILWRIPTDRATSVVTPGGLARIGQDGRVSVHDFGNGEVTLRTQVAPRLGGAPAGAVVNLPGLPRLLIVTEGEHYLAAVDLTSGEPRWRYSWGQSGLSRSKSRGVLRMKRAGKLLYFVSGDTALTAIDVITGNVVWRLRDRLRFRTAPTLHHDALFAISGGAGSLARVHGVDPYSGDVRWTSDVGAPPSVCTLEGAPLVAGSTLATVIREGDGVRLEAFDRTSGRPVWKTGVIAPAGSSWLAIDDLFFGNTPSGEIVAIDTETGALRYRQVMVPRPLDADVPRRLEPVLRSGALFVPHTDVQVIRPSDGARLATIAPCDAIPDLLRVDERCDVYIAEESGHLVSFTAHTRLSLVK